MGADFSGMAIVADASMVDYVDDWSLCRSPSRAKRRHARGHRTRYRRIAVAKKIVLRYGTTLVAHPDVIREMHRLSQVKVQHAPRWPL